MNKIPIALLAVQYQLIIISIIVQIQPIHSELSYKVDNCAQLWLKYGINQSGNYTLIFDDDNSKGNNLTNGIIVECDMSSLNSNNEINDDDVPLNENEQYFEITTIIHHDSEESRLVQGYESPGSFEKNIIYSNGHLNDGHESSNEMIIKHIEKVIDSSYSCQQYIRWDCKGSVFSFWFHHYHNWWSDRNGQTRTYWGGAEPDSNSCGCFPYCYPTAKNSTCNCDANIKTDWIEDSGLLLHKDRLPVTQLRFGDTGESYEVGRYTLGPLICRSFGHRNISFGHFTAPITLTSPGYPRRYPPPFRRHEWFVMTAPDNNRSIEMVFLDYDVIHYGAYLSVPGCRYTMEIDIYNKKTTKGHNRTEFNYSGQDWRLIHSIKRERYMPPYYITNGEETLFHLKFITCNQQQNYHHQNNNKGFKVEFRHSKCSACNLLDKNNNPQDNNCFIESNNCIHIYSYGYPFPHYLLGKHIDHTPNEYRWRIETSENYILQIEFNDFDVISTPGQNYCDNDLLTIVYDDSKQMNQIKNDYCNINRFNIGKLHSNSNYMEIIFRTSLRKVGNSRGIHATIRSMHRENYEIIAHELKNVAEGRPTDQSSTRATRDSSLAVDHNFEQREASKCSSTNYEREPWWRVNLQKRHRIYGLEIYSYLGKQLEPSPQAVVNILNDRNMDISPDCNREWPAGNYGLPMPASGCPSSKKGTDQWLTGMRFHAVQYDKPFDDKIRYWSENIMLKGGATPAGIEQHFCIHNGHDDPKMNSNENSTETCTWQPGKYCILQYGDSCPDGFHIGSITWFDKSLDDNNKTTNLFNYINGTVPKGDYTTHNTTLYFCCREDGDPTKPIYLPKTRPFYLFQYGRICQEVADMSEMEHFFHYEEEVVLYGPFPDLIFASGQKLKFQDPHPRIEVTLFDRGLTLHYCYYDIADKLKGFQVLVDTTPDTFGYGRWYDGDTGMARPVNKPFLSAVECASYGTTEEEFSRIKLNCTQPIEGQYVIIFMKDRQDALQLCEVVVFGEESCGRPLGMATEEILDSAITASNFDSTKGLVHHPYNVRLNSFAAWCTTNSDPDKHIQIDLRLQNSNIVFDSKLPPGDESNWNQINFVTIVGVAMQGMPHGFKSYYVTQFQLLFSNDSIHWTFEEEPIGRQKIYRCVQCEAQHVDPNEVVMYNLLKPVVARFIRVKILSFRGGPCMRFELIGCRGDKKNFCSRTLIASTPGVISSPNYPFYYAQYKSCVWNIRPNNSDRHIELDFIVLDLAPAEKTGGKCHDGLYINHSSQQSKIVIEAPSNSIAQSIGRPSHSFLQLNYPKKIISNGPVTLTLKTCFRFSMTRYQGFLVRFRETDCPGCGIGDSRCSRVHNCTSLCGRILSINYPLNYLNNHRCRWLIRAPAGHYFNITIEDFDITGSQPYPTNSSRNRPIKHCLFDHLSFIDPSTGMILGRYCNTNKPSKYIFSNWNELLIEFSSDSSSNGRGFKLKYQAERYNLLPEAKPLLISPLYSCPNGWLYFRGYCYSSFVEKESLQWYEAEEKCAQKAKGRDGHLVSITDYLEMNVVHYWIVEQWKLAPHQSIYIGLIDTNREGFYNWSDGNPMSYTDWYRDNLWPLESTTLFYSQQQQQKNWSTNINESNGQFTANNSPMFSWNGGDLNSFFNQYSQPDGGAYEDCTVINFHSIHSTLNWHDVPCSLGKKVMPTARMINHSSHNYNLSTTTSSINSTINHSNNNVTNSTITRNKINFNHNDGLIRSYICKMDSNSSLHQHSPRRTLYTRRIGEAKKAEIRSKVDTNRYFVCNNYEVISNLFRCDGTANCRDGSDETEGCSMNDECLESQFQCANGHCIAIGKYCDFIDDCGDGSDEIFCVRRQCKKNSEFKCNNDQCIPNYKRCNLFHDCRDQSDEDNCSGKCNLNTTFQCYYGNCIPLYALCDRHRDCPGKFFEDEHETVCSMLNQNIDQHYYMNHNYQQQQQQSNSFNLFNSYDKSFRWRRGSARNSSSSKTNRNRRQKIESTCQDDNKQIMKTNRKTCQDLLSYHGISKDGYYDLNPMDGNKLSLKVYCRFLNSTHATTIINHDTEDRLYVRSSFDAPGSYARTITYEGSIDLIVAVINASVRCKQFLSYECSGSRFNFDSPKPNSWWVSRMNRKEYSWGTDRLNYCACYPHCISNLRCNCDAGLMFNWTRDYGYIEDKNRLPIRQVAFGEVYHIGQLGYVQVGPVECMGQNVGMKLSKSTGEIESNCPMESSKLFECNSGQIIESKHLCIYEYDQLQYPIGCRDVSHLRNCSSFQCPSDYVKCPNSYCIPYRYICNGKWDCVGGLDEIGCARYTCPGHYKCANESSCIWLHQLCDGFRHCPLGDDEWFCDLNCPRNCICNGHYVDCRNSNLTIETMANISKETRKLDLSGNNLGPDLSFIDLSRFIYIGELILQNNQIEIIHSHKFIQLTNLYKLDLRYNRIRIIEAAAFAGLQQITTLLLDHNHELEEIHSGAFVGLVSLRKLNISNTKLKTIVKNTFLQMSSLQQLTLVNNQIDTIEKGAFNDLISLMSLDIRGNRITNFSKDMFIMLKSLRNLASDSFKFCCMVSNIVPFNRCYPPQDEISDCEDLLSKTVQRLILWILGFSALIGNIFVIVWRFKTLDKSNRISSTLILSLGFADFLMGIYLIMIASVDEYYRGRYIENSDYWKNSIWCHLAGFLSTLSLQTSVLTLVLIAIDRLISISFTFSNYRFTLDFTHKSLIFTWILMFILSIIPLLPIDYFQGKFYSRSGVCLAFHITITKWPGWEYSVAVFLVFNLLAFLFIVCCYIYMYKTIVTTAKKRRQMIKTTKQIRESRIGLQMALIVGTNFLCWFPVIIMGFLALGGVHIPGVAYSWIAVLVLPLNSATNPAIYTILHLIPNFSVQKQRQLDMNNRFQQSIMSLRMNHNGSSTLNNGQSESLGSNMKIFKQTNSRDLAMVLSNQHQQQQQLQRPSLSLQLIQHTNQIPLKLLMKPPPGYQCLSEFLRTKEPLVAKDLYEICLSLSKILKDYHQAGYAFNQLTCDNIFVSIYPFHVNDADTDASNNDNVDRLHAYIPPYYAYQVQRSLPSEINTNNDNIDDGEESNIDDYSMNIEEFGRIIKRMLQIYHSRSLRTNSLLITK